MLRTLVFVLVVAAAAASSIGADPASADPISDVPALAPMGADLIVSSNNAENFTVTNLPCGGSETCLGTGTATATKFRITVTNSYYAFVPGPGWLRSSTTYTVRSLAAGASLGFRSRSTASAAEFP
jgi:hypothetical protein